MQIAPQDTIATGEGYEPGCSVRFYERAHLEAGHNSVTAFSWYEPRHSYVGHAWVKACNEHLAASQAALAAHMALSDSPWYVSTFRYRWDRPGPNTYRTAERIGTPEGALF